MSPLGCAKPSGTLRLREFRPFAYGIADDGVWGYWRWLWYTISHLSRDRREPMGIVNND